MAKELKSLVLTDWGVLVSIFELNRRMAKELKSLVLTDWGVFISIFGLN